MMSIEKIKEKIIKDAEAEAKKLTESAKAEAEEIKKQNKKIVDLYKENRDREITSEIKLHKDKTLAQARLDAKSKFLEEREKLISAFIYEALEGIDRRSKEYRSYLEHSLKEALKDMEGKVTVYSDRSDSALLKSIFSSLKFSKYTLQSSDNLGLGVVIEDSGSRRTDLTINARLELVREELRQKIVEMMG